MELSSEQADMVEFISQLSAYSFEGAILNMSFVITLCDSQKVLAGTLGDEAKNPAEIVGYLEAVKAKLLPLLGG